MSSFSVAGKCLLFAYHLEAQSRLTDKRKPVGLIFCPMCLPYFPSPTVTWMWQVCFRMTLPRPLARAVKRRKFSALSTQIVLTLSSSMSAPSLCSALAIADSSTFLMIFAPFFGLKESKVSALSTGSPRIWSATSRPFCADRRTPRRIALVSMIGSLLPRRSRWGNDLLVGRVRFERPGQRELAELVSDHILRDVNRNVLLAVVNRYRQADEIRRDGRAPRPGLDRPLVGRRPRRFDLRLKVVIDERALFDRTCHLSLSLLHRMAASNDHAVGALVLAGVITLGRRPPRRDRVPVAAGPAAMRVIDRVHHLAADRRTDAAPAIGTRLADRAQVVLFVAYRPDGRPAVDVHLANLTRVHAQLRVGALACQQLHRRPGRARDLRPLARQHLDAMDGGADGNVPQRQAVAGLDRRVRAVHELRTDGQAARRDDVTALAVGVKEEREMRASVRIVLEPFDLGGDAVLVAAKVDHAVVPLVPAALMPHGDVAVIVAARAALLALDELLEGAALVQIVIDDLHEPAAAGRSRLDFDEWHDASPFLREVDFLAGLEANVRLLPIAAPAGIGAEALFLAVNVHDLHARDLDFLLLPQQLDRLLDVFLGRIGPDAEDDLVVAIGDLCRLLRNDRRQENRHQTLFVGLRRRDLGYRFGRGHPRISSNCATAALVSSTFSKRTRLTGSTSCVSRTSTCGRLREDRKTFSSTLSVTTRTVPENPSDLIFCAKSFVFGASRTICSTTDNLPSRTSCERIDAIPARYILRLTFCEKFSSGELGNILPPPRHSGLFACPARARPVPFCCHGFLCDLFTSPRDFCARLPLRAFAWNAVTT